MFSCLHGPYLRSADENYYPVFKKHGSREDNFHPPNGEFSRTRKLLSVRRR